ncbi:MAG: 50S ribosomal protein L5 [Candidatus ainarchaeum sp.]|nr:50S ribosomal protein L5 [Candidatus ainarchaeum sp.]
MQKILLEKIVINMGVGSDVEKMKRGEQVMKLITGRKPIKTHGIKRIPDWGVRPGVPLGLKITLRGEKAMTFLKEALKAKENKIKAKSFDKEGNFGFGIKEHIDLPGIKYDPKLGILGFDVLVTLKKLGYRIKVRKIKNKKIGKKQKVTKEEAMNFVKEIGVELL